jgi:hypothetical protein
MPLPFAPKPEESRVYDSLKDKLLTEITADNFDSLKGTVFAQGIDGAEDEYRRLLLLGLASNQISNSGPIPDTQFCVSVTDTAGSGSPSGNMYVPEAGTVWQLVGLEWKTKNANAINFKIEDTTNDVTTLIDYRSSTGEADMSEPIFIGYPCKLIYSVGTSSGDNTMRASLIRVR